MPSPKGDRTPWMSDRDKVRFESKVIRTDGCHHWFGEMNSYGYGQMTVRGWRISSHILAYYERHGPVPCGRQLDHLCRNPGCVNPDHLEAVTQRENILRGVGASARHAMKTHCHRGHPLDNGNVYRALLPSGYTGRRCKTCHGEWRRARYARAKAEGRK